MIAAKHRRLLMKASAQALKVTAITLPLFVVGCDYKVLETEQDFAEAGYSPRDTDKLLVVDCLLPGQVRKLGSQMTYLSARRPVKTTAAECELRGGEYVAYDRANYESALRMWLPLAQQGDAEAQVNVGEIYEKGLGRTPDAAQAADWYRKAAEQGNSRAQMNLGYLYEKGLGMPQDLAMALNWYRKATGLEGSDLQFTAVIEKELASAHEEELEALRQDARRRQQEADQLRQQLSASQSRLRRQQEELLDVQQKLDATRRKLQQEINRPQKNESLIRSLQSELDSNQAQLKSRREEISQLQQKVQKQEKYVTRENQIAKEQEQQIIAKLSTVAPKKTSTYQELFIARQELNRGEEQLSRKENEYHDIFLEIKKDLAQLSGNGEESSQAVDKTQLRADIERRKGELEKVGKEINAFKKRVAAQRKEVAELEASQPTQLALAGPLIEIIDPPMTLTRGLPSVQLRSALKAKEIVGRVDAPAGLIKLTVNDTPLKVDDYGLFRALIPIEAPTTDVKIVAIDKTGKHSDLGFRLLAKSQESPTAVNETPQTPRKALTYKSIDFGRYHALIIGNNDYSELPALKTAVNDAMAVEKMLKSRYGFQTKLLINANRHQIMTALNQLRTTLSDKDNLLIYYAGHGERDKEDLSAYWLPVDAELGNAANWISSHSITQYLNIMPAKHILVVADSCYSGAMTKTAMARLPDDISEEKREKWLRFMVGKKTRTVLTSGGVKPVLDQGDGTNSLFAKAFLDALQSNTGLMEDYDVYRRIFPRVKAGAASVGFEQKPEYAPLQHAGHEGSPFFFVPAS